MAKVRINLLDGELSLSVTTQRAREILVDIEGVCFANVDGEHYPTLLTYSELMELCKEMEAHDSRSTPPR